MRQAGEDLVTNIQTDKQINKQKKQKTACACSDETSWGGFATGCNNFSQPECKTLFGLHDQYKSC